MFNQLRAEWYKLFHTRALLLTVALVAVVFVIYAAGGEQMFLTAGDLQSPAAGNTIGFISGVYADPAHPQAQEIIRTATSYTVFFWLIAIVFAVVFFSREYASSTLKIAIASGTGRLRFFLAKAVVILIVTLVLYLGFIWTAFFLECRSLKLPLASAQPGTMLRIAGENTLVLAAFLCTLLALCVLVRHSALVITLMTFYIFSGALLTMASFDTMVTQSWRVRAYLYANPIYYWMHLCSGAPTPTLVRQTLVYGFVACALTLAVAMLRLRRQEIR